MPFKNIQIPFPEPNLGLEVKGKLRKANQRWKKVKQNASKTWNTFIEKLAEAKAWEGTMKVERQLKCLQLQEKQRKSSARI